MASRAPTPEIMMFADDGKWPRRSDDPEWQELLNGPIGSYEPTGAALVAAQSVDMAGPRYSLQEVLDEIEAERSA